MENVKGMRECLLLVFLCIWAYGWSPDLIEHGLTEFTFQVGNVQSLINCILNLKAIYDKDKNAINNAVNKKISQYSMDNATFGLNKALELIK